MARLTIVGQAPARRRGQERALEGPCGERLARLAGLGCYEELRRRARLVNVLAAWPGKAGKGDAFPAAAARAAAGEVTLRGRVLLAGRGVAKAFGVDAPFFEWVRVGRARVAVVPHPSGVNHWWNDPGNRLLAAGFMRGTLA